MLVSEHPVVGTYHVRSMLHFQYPQSTLRVKCNACDKGFRDGVKVKAAMEMKTFTIHLINMSTGHCTDKDTMDNPINVK